MRERLRILIAACFYYSGLIKLASWWARRSGQYLVIINYHRAMGQNIWHQMRYLRHHYRVLHLEDALRELYGPHQCNTLPLMAITFDDGYLDNYTHGLRLARELQVPITVFPVSSNIDDGKCFSWRAGESLVSRSRVEKVTLNGRTYYLAHEAEKQALAHAVHDHMRYATSVAEREAFLEAMQQALEVPLPDRSQEGMNNVALPLSWDEVCEMQQSGLVSFGAHTVHHPVLGYLTDKTELEREVTECRSILEQHLGHPVYSFAYPVGRREHISDDVLQAVKSAGYRWAVTTIEGSNTCQTDPYLLRRLPGDINTHWLVMAAELSGLLGVLSRFRKKRYV